MKNFLLYLLLLFSFPLCYSQSVSLSSPIYLGPMLIDEPDTAHMATICRNYKLKEIVPKENYKAFVHPDGTTIQFKVEESSNGRIPIVEVITSEKEYIIKQIITNCGFIKTKNSYYRGNRYSGRITTCDITKKSPKTVIFKKVSTK